MIKAAWAIAALWITTTGASSSSGLEYFQAAGIEKCPSLCEETGSNPANWTRYHDLSQLVACNREPKLLDFALHTPLKDNDSPSVVYTCISYQGHDVFRQVNKTYAELEANSKLEKSKATLNLFHIKSTGETIMGQKITAIKEVQASLLFQNTTTTTTTTTNETNNPAGVSYILHYGDTTVGAFVGGGINARGVAIVALQQLLEYAIEPSSENAQTIAAELCNKNTSADATMGLIVDSTPGQESLFRVQAAIKSWSGSNCTTGLGLSKPWEVSSLWVPKRIISSAPYSNSTSFRNNTSSGNRLGAFDDGGATVQANCRYIQVNAGDGCDTLASRCGVSGYDFERYNSRTPNLCSSLKEGQYVCCSEGDLPDFKPKPQPDGTCASYAVQKGDSCSKIAAANGLTLQDLEDFNKKTWGWSGCEKLYFGINVCLSYGYPALPVAVPNAVCGPQKPGTQRPAPGSDMTKLNPCPLNACCNIWGQCGTTTEFCTESTLGPPGTSKPGVNGCISNCGTDIVNIVRPDQFIKVGYFEGWNHERSCLRMGVEDTHSSFTHIHFAFADVGPGFSVSAARVRHQFDRFVSMQGVKRIIAFGGWAASTDPSTYRIFRDGVKPGNREKLATNLAKFVNDHNLDGIDLDWEYPGAPDIEGIPPADVIDGPNYLELLKLLRQKLPNKSISIAAPASYWYLKAFPIGEIAKVVNYIIYMTYDLHGQWDYNNPWSNPACPTGNCLRSHINMTETLNALSMITKADVPTNKIIVGVSSYGRSFRMTDPKCTGVMCTFTGPQSGAKPGRCTDSRGYISNAEISEIIATDSSARTYFDDSSYSNILVYENDWVAYMDNQNKATREILWKAFGFGGTTDWAVDLDHFVLEEVTNPGNPAPIKENMDFASISCNNEWYKNPDVIESKQWSELKANDAWNYAVNRWQRRDSSSGITFPHFVAKILNYTVNMDCGVLTEGNSCKGPVLCNDASGPSPAGTLVLSSFVALNNFYLGLYNGVRDGHTNLLTTLPGFVSTFAPEQKPDKVMGWILDFLGTGLGMVGGPLLKSAFDKSKFFTANPKYAEKAESSIMSAVEFGTDKAKEAAQKGDVPVAVDKLASALLAFTTSWKSFLTKATEDMFNGNEKSIRFLGDMIDNGKLTRLGPVSLFEGEQQTVRTLYSYFIPYVWGLRRYSPVLINAGWKCTDVGKGDYQPYLPKDYAKTSVCIDGNQYYLTAPDSIMKDCTWNNRIEKCTRFPLLPLPGADDLESKDEHGNVKYGGLTKLQMAKSILHRASIRGNKNLDRTPDIIKSPEIGKDLWDMIKRGGDATMMPGVINIPTCDLATVMDNWQAQTVAQRALYPAYPCNKE